MAEVVNGEQISSDEEEESKENVEDGGADSGTPGTSTGPTCAVQQTTVTTTCDTKTPEEEDVQSQPLNTISSAPTNNLDEIDLDYGEDPVKGEGESESLSGRKSSTEDGELSEGEVTSSEDGEIRDEVNQEESKNAKISKKSKSELEDGELEEGEIDDSDEEEVPLSRRPEKIPAHPRITAPPSMPLSGCGRRNRKRRNRSRSPRPRTQIAGGSVSRVTAAAQSALPHKEESAWERGLREARELMKKASRKKQDPDFDHKRMLLAPSDERDWKVDSDEERVSSRRIPSLLELRCSPPLRGRERITAKRGDNRRGERYRGYEVPPDLGPQCIYPNGRPEPKRRAIKERREPDRSQRNMRSRSPPPRPDPISSSSSPIHSLSRSPSRRAFEGQPKDAARKVMGGVEDRPNDPWARKRRTSPRSKKSSASSSRSASRSRSSSSSRSRHSRNRLSRSPPTGDITSYRIPKKKGGQPPPHFRGDPLRTERRSPPLRFPIREEGGRAAPCRDRGRNRDDHQNGGVPSRDRENDRRRPPPGKTYTSGSNAVSRRDGAPMREIRQVPGKQTPPPVDLEPRGAEAISDDESASSRRSSRSRSSYSSRSRSSSRSTSASSASSSSSSSSARSSRSASPALPAKYRLSNVGATVEEKEKKGKKRSRSRSKSAVSDHFPITKRASPKRSSNKKNSPPSKRVSPPKRAPSPKSSPLSPVRQRKGRPRTPSATPPPPPHEPTPPPPPAEEGQSRERGMKKRKRERVPAVQDRPKTKAELMEELRKVEAQLIKKRRAAAL